MALKTSASTSFVEDLRRRRATEQSEWTKAIMQRNAATSSLLKLPIEIREQIFRYLLGDHVFHVVDCRCCIATGYWPYTSKGLNHEICPVETFPVPMDEGGKPSFVADPPLYDPQCTMPMCSVGQSKCLKTVCGELETFPRLRMNSTLRLLRVSWQVYEECFYLLWTTNTFSLPDSHTFSKFVSTIKPLQKQTLRHLAINIAWTDSEFEGWARALKADTLKSLSSIHTLHIRFSRSDVWRHNRSSFSNHIYFNRDTDMWRNTCLPLRTLKLKHVTITIVDSSHSTSHSVWNVPEAKEFAHEMRSMLLDPKGAEIVEAEIKADKAEKQRLSEAERLEVAARIAARNAMATVKAIARNSAKAATAETTEKRRSLSGTRSERRAE